MKEDCWSLAPSYNAPAFLFTQWRRSSMGSMIELTASDGHKFGAYKAEPVGKPRGAVVVVMRSLASTVISVR